MFQEKKNLLDKELFIAKNENFPRFLRQSKEIPLHPSFNISLETFWQTKFHVR